MFSLPSGTAPASRKRVTTVSKKSIQYLDTVPDENAAYWYWIKLVLKSGQTAGVGPFVTPDADVWTPGT